MEERVERRLAAILCADVVEYSRLMSEDEEGTLAVLKSDRRELIDPLIAQHGGRIFKTTGDGILIEFASVVDAVRCAVVVQQGMADRNVNRPEPERIRFRIGINLGDVIHDEGDIFGDGVNVAARLQTLAEPGEICVSASVREQVGEKLPVGFADKGQHGVKNIARPVRVYRVEKRVGTRTYPAGDEVTAPPELPDRPSIAVLPFANMSGDPEQDYFVDGMVEDIITGLSRIKWLFVIARNSSFAYKGKSPDIRQVGRELGVRYVLEGSVRRAAARVRITGQLVEAETGRHIWAERYDRAIDDVFVLQDEITLSVVGAIEPSLRRAEIERVRRKRRSICTLMIWCFVRRLSSRLQWPTARRSRYRCWSVRSPSSQITRSRTAMRPVAMRSCSCGLAEAKKTASERSAMPAPRSSMATTTPRHWPKRDLSLE